jgi:uncharacterized protein YaaQ
MKMVMAVMPRDEAEKVLQALVDAEHTATFMETRGGMLRQAQMTLFVAVKDEGVDQVLDIIDQTCHSQATVESRDEETGLSSGLMPTKPRLGGAVIFIWEIDRSETY